jgi:hypothetical protein
MDVAHKGLAILAAAASGLFVLWQWGKQRGQFTRDEGFNKYIRELCRIEQQVVQAERDENVNYRQLTALREQLHQLKREALDRFTEGGLAGKELLAGFLLHIHDARDYLTRLIQRQEESLKHTE